MKKIISLLATVAMVSTLFVSVVKADVQPTITTTKTSLDNDAFKALTKNNIPTGYNAYLLTVDFSNLGDLNCELSVFEEHSGRKLQGVSYTMTFNSLENVNTTWTRTLTNKFNGATLSKGYDGNSYRVNFSAGSASDAYPSDEQTISNASIADALKFLVVTADGSTVTATLSATMNFVTYEEDVTGTEEPKNSLAGTITMTPASYEFAAAAPTPVDIPAEGSIKATASGVTGLTDLQGNTIPALSKNYGIAQFSTTIDTANNDYVLAVEAGAESTTFDVDFDEIGVEATNASVNFFAIVDSSTRTITGIKLQAIAKSNS